MKGSHSVANKLCLFFCQTREEHLGRHELRHTESILPDLEDGPKASRILQKIIVIYNLALNSVFNYSVSGVSIYRISCAEWKMCTLIIMHLLYKPDYK